MNLFEPHFLMHTHINCVYKCFAHRFVHISYLNFSVQSL